MTAGKTHFDGPAQEAPCRMLCSAWLVAGLVFIWSFAAPALAQSAQGCVGLETGQVPSVEGTNGVFFRIDPDLVMETRVPDALVSGIGELSQALARRGTTLVFVPVPTKSLAMPSRLGTEPARYGYDVRVARSLYADSISRLRSEGVSSVDAVEALQATEDAETVFFKTDPRLTNSGLRALAQAVGLELGSAGRGDAVFETHENQEIILESRERFLLQLNCQGQLPQVRTAGYATRMAADTGLSDVAPMVLAGTSLAGGEDLNLAGFLSEAVGRPVIRQVFADSATEALSIYLTSGDIDKHNPAVIVWLMPVWENPGRFGDQPMRELVAAALDECEPIEPAERVSDTDIRVELAMSGRETGQVLRLIAEGAPVREASFRFTSDAGQSRERLVVRQNAATSTNRVFLPMTGLWPSGATAVSVRTDTPLSAGSSLALCQGEVR